MITKEEASRLSKGARIRHVSQRIAGVPLTATITGQLRVWTKPTEYWELPAALGNSIRFMLTPSNAANWELF